MKSILIALFLLVGSQARADGPRFAVQFVQCEHHGVFATKCPLFAPAVRARVVRQISQANCVQDQSFGFRGNEMWVAWGCRAQFAVTLQLQP